MNSTALYFNFYGVQAELQIFGSSSEEISAFFKNEFSYFSGLKSKPVVSFHLYEEDKRRFKKNNIYLFRTRSCEVYGWGSERYCKYGSHGEVFSSNSKNKRFFEISCAKKNDLIEISFMAFLSVIGEELDRQGYHRAHALAFEYKGHGVLALLPQGGGKSALSMFLKDDSSFRILSDENPLLKNGVLFSYPNAIGLHEATLDGLGFGQEGGYLFSRRAYPSKLRFPWKMEKIAMPTPISIILNGSRSETANIVNCNPLLTLSHLSHSLVVGVGLAQMAEHMLRLPSVSKLSAIAFSRMKEAIHITKKSKSFSFGLSTDAKNNFRVLSNFLNSLC